MADNKNKEEIRKEKIKKLKEQKGSQGDLEQQKKQAEAQKKAILKKYLTNEARSRLSNLRMARPEFTKKVESALIQLINSGRIKPKVDDDQLKNLLKKLDKDKGDYDIKGMSF